LIKIVVDICAGNFGGHCA